MKSGLGQRPPRGHYSGNQPQQQRILQRSQSYDSNGPDIRVRGSANQIFERYIALAREAAIGDDRIAAENFYQHAEHYFRITNTGRDSNKQGSVPSTGSNDTETNKEVNGESDETGERLPTGYGVSAKAYKTGSQRPHS